MSLFYESMGKLDPQLAKQLINSLAVYDQMYGPEFFPRDLPDAERLVEVQLDLAKPQLTLLAERIELNAVLLRDLPFDSSIYRIPMAQILYWIGPSDQPLRDALAVAKQREVKHIHYRVPTKDTHHLQLAETHGFRIMTVFMALVGRLGPKDAMPVTTSKNIEIERANSDDLPLLQAIGREAFSVGTRFHADQSLSVDGSQLLHERWIENCCRGLAADEVLVARASDDLAGFISCKLERSLSGALRRSIGSIGLFVVAAKWRGQGIGRFLLAAAKRWFADRGVECVEVGTEGSNFRALNAYIKAGFQFTWSACSLHLKL